MSSGPAAPGPLLRAFAHASLVYLFVAGGAWVAGLSIAETTQSETLLPTPERRTLVAREFAALALTVYCVAGPLSWLAYALGARLRGAPRLAAQALLVLTVTAPVLLYLASWITFRSNGRFLDSAGLAFMAANPLPFFQHVAHIEPYLLVTAPLALLAVTVGLIWGAAALVNRAGRNAPFVWIGIALGLTCVSGWLGAREPSATFPADQFVTDPDAGMVYTYLDLYAECRDDRAGPISRVRADLAALRRPQSLRADPTIGVERAAIVALDDFVAGVDRGRVQPWNVVLVIVESLRPDQLQVFGGTREVMPGVEQVARDGVAYSDHYTQASHSNYADICPLSGRYPLRSERVHLYPKTPSYPRVPIYEVLHALGWRTAVVSSQNEIWGQMINYLRSGHLDHFFHSESFEGPTYVPRHDTGFEEFLKGSKRSGKIDDRFTIDEAVRWIDSGSAPFFLYLNLQNSHLPYETPADFPRRFGPARLPFQIRFGGFPRDQIQTVKDVYADSLAYSDHQLSRLVAHLKERGEWDRTLIVVTGDTGQAFYEHGFVAHANRIYDELMRVPLVIRAPGLTPRVDPRPAQHIDVAPTILDLLGIPPHPSFQGVSLVSEDPAPDRSRYLLVQAPLAHQYGVVRDGFKLVHDAERDKTTLVNLRRDPGETRDLSKRRPVLTEELRRRVDTWRALQLEYYNDPAIHTRSYPPVLSD
jgi:arylsulfatase A-like enzyme